MKGLLFAIPFILTGCCSQPVYEKPKISLPIVPVLPEVSSQEVSCLSKETFTNLARRELKLRDYSEKCITILKEVTVNE
jgi:hypothetical protein